jgi:hypothetical protein
MKKLLFILLLGFSIVSLTFTGCHKDEDQGDCNCGTIVNDGINYSGYWFVISNECSGNDKTFYVSESDWMSYYVGDFVCTDDYGWKKSGEVNPVDQFTTRKVDKYKDR